MCADLVKQLCTCAAILLIHNNHCSLIQQDQPTPRTWWGGYWVNIWGKRDAYADREDNQASGFSKAYQQARNLQQHLRKAHGKIYHTLCAANEVTSLHARS